VYRAIRHLQTKKAPLVSLKPCRYVSQEGKKPRVKKAEDRTEGMHEESYSKESLSVNLQHTCYFKRISQRISHAGPKKLQVSCFSQQKANCLAFARSRKHGQKHKFILS